MGRVIFSDGLPFVCRPYWVIMSRVDLNGTYQHKVQPCFNRAFRPFDSRWVLVFSRLSEFQPPVPCYQGLNSWDVLLLEYV